MRSTHRVRGPLTAVSLREVYHLPGDYIVKMLLGARDSASYDDVTVSIRNADGSPMPHSFRRWGTKLTLSFTIDDSTPDGVAIIDVTMAGRGVQPRRERFDFWIVK